MSKTNKKTETKKANDYIRNNNPKTNTTNAVQSKTYINTNNSDYLEMAIDGSMRLFGMPHQFIESADPRIGTKSNLGRCFAERIVMEAPIVAIKPGLPDFLPGRSKTEKMSFISAIQEAASNSEVTSQIFSTLSVDDEDNILYYQLKSKYSEMMATTNLLCKILAVFIGIADKKVPWAPAFTFGTYDWRYYTVKNQYNETSFKQQSASGSLGMFVKEAFETASNYIMADNEWVRFYVDSNSSFNESSSNSTTSSILESYAEKLEGVAKELEVVSQISGADIQGLANSSASSVDSFINEHANGDGAISTFLKRLSGNTKQIISGGNFLIPEIWSQSEYNKGYSFSITLSTPYGCPESWFLNIGVPLMHILSLCLPRQLTANTYQSPYLVKCTSPGWFNCDLGIIDSVSIDKGSDNSWAIGGLPNEVKVSLSVKDLYSSLAIPVNPYDSPGSFLSNTGMLEFLMVNCGIDITRQDMSDRLKVWGAIISNSITDRVTKKPYDIQQFFKSKTQGLFKLIK